MSDDAQTLIGLVCPDPAIAKTFATYGLACVAVAGIWGAVTVMIRILYIQTVPAVLGLNQRSQRRGREV